MNLSMSLVPEFEDLYNKFASSPEGLEYLKIEGIDPKHLDIGVTSHDFFENKLADVSTDGNASFVDGISPSSYRVFTSNGQMKLLGYHMLWYYSMKRYGREFADKAISMIWDGSIYFHDAHGLRIQMPYCFAFSLDKIVYEGRPYGTSPNVPPKHRKSFLSQVDKLICDMSKQFAGAVAPSDFFLWYAYFCKLDGLDLNNPDDITTIEQDLQGFVLLLNEPSRAEGEPPFTNISIYDNTGLHTLFDHIVYPDFSRPDMEYIMRLQRIFCEMFSKGDPLTGFPYKFPVVTQNLTTDNDDEFVDDEQSRWVAHVNRPLGNFNLHFGGKAKLAMCCRYENDLEDMNLTPDSFGNGGVNIGSHRVVTPNYARAAMLARHDMDKFKEIMDDYFDVSAKLLYVHRIDILKKRIERSPDYLIFFGKLGWFNLDTMFSTFGVEGIYEAVRFLGYDILDDDGTDCALDIMAYVKSKVKQYRNEYGYVFNAEEIPGEQACVTLLQKDKMFINAQDVDDDVYDELQECHLYSNQYIPLINDADMVTRLDLSGRFMRMISGGGIVHLNSEGQIDTDGKMYNLMKLAAKSGVPHVAVCYRFGKCMRHKASIVGQGTKNCPVCGDPIVWTRARVIGYFTDEINWNPVRRKWDAPYRHYSTEELEDE